MEAGRRVEVERKEATYHVCHVRCVTEVIVELRTVPFLCSINSLSVWYNTQHLHVAILSPGSHALDLLAPMAIREMFESLFTRYRNSIQTSDHNADEEIEDDRG
jgi:hypothetical protein